MRKRQLFLASTALTSFVFMNGCISGPKPVRAPDFRYAVKDLGPGEALAINNAGVVVKNDTNVENGFYLVKDGRSAEIVGAASTGYFDEFPVYGINNEGHVAGCNTTGREEPSKASLWVGGTPRQLGTLGGTQSAGLGVNDLDTVVGWSGIDPVQSSVHGFIWRKGLMVDVGVLPGGEVSRARAVNNRDEVVGLSQSGKASNQIPRRAFYWRDGGMTDLGTLGGTESCATDINDSGHIVGWSGVSPEHSRIRATMWLDGKPQALLAENSPNSRAYAINNHDQIVGDIEGKAFIWSNGRVVDLNSTIPKGSSWVLETAVDINDNGWIVGGGKLNGSQHAFLLVPIH